MSLALHYWMEDVHHCSGPPSPKWPILCRVGRYTLVIPYCLLMADDWFIGLCLYVSRDSAVFWTMWAKRLALLIRADVVRRRVYCNVCVIVWRCLFVCGNVSTTKPKPLIEMTWNLASIVADLDGPLHRFSRSDISKLRYKVTIAH